MRSSVAQKRVSRSVEPLPWDDSKQSTNPHIYTKYISIVDTTFPDENAQIKCRYPFYFPEFVSGSHDQGTREIVMSESSPRNLLHITPTDPPRRIFRLANSRQRDFGKPHWMVLWPECRGSDDHCLPYALTSHLSFSLLSTGLLYLPVLSHTPLS